jgi:hypothetical protein
MPSSSPLESGIPLGLGVPYSLVTGPLPGSQNDTWALPHNSDFQRLTSNRLSGIGRFSGIDTEGRRQRPGGEFFESLSNASLVISIRNRILGEP